MSVRFSFVDILLLSFIFALELLSIVYSMTTIKRERENVFYDVISQDREIILSRLCTDQIVNKYFIFRKFYMCDIYRFRRSFYLFEKSIEENLFFTVLSKNVRIDLFEMK